MEKATKIDDIIRVFNTAPLKTKEALEKFRVDTIEFRTGNIENSPINNIFKICTSSYMQSSCILMGHRGCGKSTELNYLFQELKKNGYTALSIDTATESNLLDIDYFDIMLLITEGLLKIAEQQAVSLSENLITDVLDFFKETVTETSTEEGNNKTRNMGAGINIPLLSNILKIFGDIKKEYKFNTGKRKTIKEVVNRKSSLWLEYITDISNTIIHKLHFKSPVLILEGLDRIEQREDNAFNIFTNTTLSQLNFPVIYTFPVSLRYSSRFQDVVNIYGANIFTLPMVKITNKEDNTFYDAGINILKEIVYKRADRSLFEEGAIDLLVRKTGGSIRDIFNCIVLAVRYAENVNQSTVLKKDIELALTELTSQLRLSLITSDYAKLWKIHEDKQDIDDNNLMLKYLRARVVLEYNGEHWFDVHPLVFDFIDERLKARPELKPR